MKSHTAKILLACLTLFLYINISVFGLLSLFHFEHSAETPMINCPYAENGYSICQSSLDHIKNWRHFSNVIIPSLSIFSLLVLGIVLYLFGKQNLLNQDQYFYKWKYYLTNKKLLTYSGRIIKWLSLFENSPSLSYLRHR